MIDDFAINLRTLGYDPLKTVVRCLDLSEAEIFLHYLCNKGVWTTGQIALLIGFYDMYKDKSCYHFSRTEWCSESFYRKQRKDYKIVNFCDIYAGHKANVFDFAIGFDELMNGVPTNGGGVSF
jgi:hypothetical protein